jgi:hypothetical protein
MSGSRGQRSQGVEPSGEADEEADRRLDVVEGSKLVRRVHVANRDRDQPRRDAAAGIVSEKTIDICVPEDQLACGECGLRLANRTFPCSICNYDREQKTQDVRERIERLLDFRAKLIASDYIYKQYGLNRSMEN